MVKENVHQLSLRIVEVGTKFEHFPHEEKLAHCINKRMSRKNVVKTIEIYISIPKIILRNTIFQKIAKRLCKIVNSIIVRIE